jgi:hypothetical protein
MLKAITNANHSFYINFLAYQRRRLKDFFKIKNYIIRPLSILSLTFPPKPKLYNLYLQTTYESSLFIKLLKQMRIKSWSCHARVVCAIIDRHLRNYIKYL